MKHYLEYLGVQLDTGSPREIIKESFAHHLILNGEIWIKMILARNSLSHMYDEQNSRQIYYAIKNEYLEEIEKLVKFFEKRQ